MIAWRLKNGVFCKYFLVLSNIFYVDDAFLLCYAHGCVMKNKTRAQLFAGFTLSSLIAPAAIG